MPNDKDFELDDLEPFSFDDLSLDDAPAPETPVPEAAEEDPLGVWVKSAPEDVGSAEDSEVPEIPPLAPSEDLAEEDFLSTEELANLDDSFEFVTVEEPLAGETALDEDMAFLDTPEAVEAEHAAKKAEPVSSFNEVSLDDFVTFDDVSLEDDLPAESAAKPGDEALEDEPFDDEFLDIDIDIDDDINDEELEILEGARPKAPPASAQPAGMPSQEIDLSEFVDFEEVSPAQETLPAAELPGEEGGTVPALEQQDGFFEESILEEPLPPLEEEGSIVFDTDLEPDDVTDMDHLMALEDHLTSGIRQPEPAPARPEADLAAQILGKIEQELSSIKQEISELKKEMTHMRAVPPAPAAEPSAAPAPEPAEEEPLAVPGPDQEAPKASHGFFDEEDDETIALTGDELDNILSTAEVSEGEETGVTLDEDLLDTDAEGNLVEPAATVTEEEAHVTDEEFLAGTGLDVDDAVFETEEPSGEEEDLAFGVPDSIELEESFPESLEEGETENLLDVPAAEETPLTEISFEDDQGLESVDLAPLAPELTDEPAVPEGGWDDVAMEDEPAVAEASDTDAEGWTALGEDEPEVAVPEAAGEPPAPLPPAAPVPPSGALTSNVKEELRAVLSYMDKLLASLPDDKIQEFAESEHFEVYKRLFEELGLIE